MSNGRKESWKDMSQTDQIETIIAQILKIDSRIEDILDEILRRVSGSSEDIGHLAYALAMLVEAKRDLEELSMTSKLPSELMAKALS